MPLSGSGQQREVKGRGDVWDVPGVSLDVRLLLIRPCTTPKKENLFTETERQRTLRPRGGWGKTRRQLIGRSADSRTFLGPHRSARPLPEASEGNNLLPREAGGDTEIDRVGREGRRGCGDSSTDPFPLGCPTPVCHRSSEKRPHCRGGTCPLRSGKAGQTPERHLLLAFPRTVRTGGLRRQHTRRDRTTLARRTVADPYSSVRK